MEGEVMGIMGANATGKTTFVKMLAGTEEPDSGNRSQFSVSHKPQYISPGKGMTAGDAFEAGGINKEVFESEIRKRLSLDSLMEKKLETLSGGELQRVAIGLCLARDAELYLLDEPSAFLDAEQRLQAAHAIKTITEKRKKACFLVEHDILFQDNAANRLVVFSGDPGRKGFASAPVGMRSGMNSFLKTQGVTFRRDPQTGRPRANKQGSVLDEEQKKSGEYFYSE